MPRVLSVGQCGFDHGKIARHMKQAFGAEVVAADTFPEALEALRGGPPFDLVLVNRVTDADGSRGLDLVRDLNGGPTPVMLVSNYPEAQEQAVSLGALPGFGKSDLGLPAVHERLKRVLVGPKLRIAPADGREPEG
jgi:two-component system chemotaxis response regulator CheY